MRPRRRRCEQVIGDLRHVHRAEGEGLIAPRLVLAPILFENCGNQRGWLACHKREQGVAKLRGLSGILWLAPCRNCQIDDISFAN